MRRDNRNASRRFVSIAIAVLALAACEAEPQGSSDASGPAAESDQSGTEASPDDSGGHLDTDTDAGVDTADDTGIDGGTDTQTVSDPEPVVFVGASPVDLGGIAGGGGLIAVGVQDPTLEVQYVAPAYAVKNANSTERSFHLRVHDYREKVPVQNVPFAGGYDIHETVLGLLTVPAGETRLFKLDLAADVCLSIACVILFRDDATAAELGNVRIESEP